MLGEQPATFLPDGTTAELCQQGFRVLAALQPHVMGIEISHLGLGFPFVGP